LKPELKELCRAANSFVTGTIPDLIERLENHEFVKEVTSFTDELLREKCRELSIPEHGSRFDLVLRLIHQHKGTTPGANYAQGQMQLPPPQPINAQQQQQFMQFLGSLFQGSVSGHNPDGKTDSV